jgi:flavin-dependent dehydrogenase
MDNATILIVGGGPGGLSTALHLARLDPQLTTRILILEKEHYPRPKLCAGGLVADAEIILKRLGLDVSEIPHVDVEAAHFDFAGSGLKICPPNGYAFRVIRRDEFDAWLAENAKSRGIKIREGIAVKAVLPDPDGVTVETDQGIFRAQIVVGADGSNGVTRRCILPNEPLSTSRTLEVVVANREPQMASAVKQPPIPQGLLRRGDHPPRNDIHKDAYFDFFPVPQNVAGYVWDFPTQVKGQPMRCWGVYDSNLLAGQKRPMLKDMLANGMAKHGFNLEECEIQSHPIRWFEPQNRFSAPRVLLVGDAAGADPLFGEGISIALGYGAIAAREIAESLRRGEFSFRGYKSRLARSGLGQALFARWFVANLIYSFKWAWFQFLLWRVMQPVVMLAAWVFILNWSKRIK